MDRLRSVGASASDSQLTFGKSVPGLAPHHRHEPGLALMSRRLGIFSEPLASPHPVDGCIIKQSKLSQTGLSGGRVAGEPDDGEIFQGTRAADIK